MRMTPELNCACISRTTSMICAWMVTSSAVVGSSAIRMSGLQLIAMAIMARWRMPPENSNGYWSTRLGASGMPTRASRSMAIFHASRLDLSWCSVMASPICLPIFMTGFRLVMGSWKIIAMSLPRTSRISSSLMVRRLRSPSMSEPSTTLPGGSGMRRMSERAATVLPEPDSPTMPMVSLRSSVKLTPLTALTTPAWVKKWVERSLTSRRRSAMPIPSAWGRWRRAGRCRTR